MSTASRILPSSAASSVLPMRKRRRLNAKQGLTSRSLCDMPLEVLEKVLSSMVDQRMGLGIMKLSMTCRQIRREVQGNLDIWYRLYRHWRGPVRPAPTQHPTMGRVVSLRPTYPLSLPNYQMKPPPMT